MTNPEPIHPGEHLAEFMQELGITQYGLAKTIGVPPIRVHAIVNRRRSITTDTATVSITVDDVLPSAPRNVVLTHGDAQINVAWTAPEHNGGASIDRYRVRHRTTAAAASWNYSAPLTVSPYVIERLDNGTVYEVEVQARNSLQPHEFGHWAMVDPVTP